MNKSEFEHILIVNCSDKEEVIVLSDVPFSIGRHSSNSLIIHSKLICKRSGGFRQQVSLIQSQ